MTNIESPGTPPPVKKSEFTGSGTDDRLRVELENVANELAAKHTMPFVVPVKQILAAVYKVFADVPRIPNYDAELPWNEQPSWMNAMTISLTELPENPSNIRSWYVTDTGEVGVMIESGDACAEIKLEPTAAKDFFLHGLAAVLHAERQRELITQIDEPA